MAKFKVSDLVKDLPPPAKKKVYFLLGAGTLGCIISLLAIVGLIRLQPHRSHPVVTPVASAEHSAPREVASYTFPYEIRDISVQLMDRTGTRTAHVQFSISLDCPSAEAKHDMVLNRAKLLDSVFEVASQFYLEDFQSGNGLTRLKAALKKNYDEYFKSQSPREIAINDWAMN